MYDSVVLLCVHRRKQEVEITLPVKGKKGGKGAVGKKIKAASTTVPHSTVTSQMVLSPGITVPPQNSIVSPSPLLSSQSVGSINATTVLPGAQQQVIKVRNSMTIFF